MRSQRPSIGSTGDSLPSAWYIFWISTIPRKQPAEAATQALAVVLLELLEGQVGPVQAVDTAGDQAQQGHRRRIPGLPDGAAASGSGCGLRLCHRLSPVCSFANETCLSARASKVNDLRAAKR